MLKILFRGVEFFGFLLEGWSCSKKVVQERSISSSGNEVTSKSEIGPENNKIVVEGQ